VIGCEVFQGYWWASLGVEAPKPVEEGTMQDNDFRFKAMQSGCQEWYVHSRVVKFLCRQNDRTTCTPSSVKELPEVDHH
jgi:hypothetical protein